MHDYRLQLVLFCIAFLNLLPSGLQEKKNVTLHRLFLLSFSLPDQDLTRRRIPIDEQSLWRNGPQFPHGLLQLIHEFPIRGEMRPAI